MKPDWQTVAEKATVGNVEAYLELNTDGQWDWEVVVPNPAGSHTRWDHGSAKNRGEARVAAWNVVDDPKLAVHRDAKPAPPKKKQLEDLF